METEAKLAVPYSEFFTCCHKYMLCDILSSICYQPHIWQDQHHGIKGVCVCGVASFPHPTQIIIISNTEEKVGGGPCSNKAIMCAHIWVYYLPCTQNDPVHSGWAFPGLSTFAFTTLQLVEGLGVTLIW